MADYVLSDSGVKVWKSPAVHPLLRATDTHHRAFLDKKAETFSRGKVKGMPRICSENSEDACTWQFFSPLIRDKRRRRAVLTDLLNGAFPRLPKEVLGGVAGATLGFWPKLNPPSARPQREGRSEPDLLIELGDSSLVLVEAKYKSGVSLRTSHDPKRDQIIRLIDVASWYARQRKINRSYVIGLQYGDAKTNVESMVNRYAGNPSAIRQSLPYRSDLDKNDFEELARSVAFVRWPDPMADKLP